MKLNLCSWGGAEEVTGSKHLLSWNGRQLLFDCGMHQGRRREAREKNERFPFDPAGVEALLLSHSHFDHCGAIPIAVKNGFEGNIWCTPASREIAALILMDSAHLQAKDAEFVSKKRERNSEWEREKEPVPVEPLYNEEEVIRSLEHFVSVSYHRPIPLGPGVEARFYDAGHILGSCLTRVEIREGGRSLAVGFTGDLGRKAMVILRDPETLPPVDYLLCESTYGNRRHDEMGKAMEELAEVVNEVWRRGGRLIIPSFAVERTQEIVFYLHLLHDEGRIPAIPIYVDSPMAVNATAIFRTHPECYDEQTRRVFLEHHKNPFGFESLHFVTSTSASKALNNRRDPMVIISSSGMCEGGRILHHLANNIEDQSTIILIVGFMAQHTLGRRLADREKEVRIFGRKYQVRARVKIINAFSAHADYEEIREWMQGLDRERLRGVFLVHGEPEAQAHLAEVLRSDGIPRVEILRRGEPVELD